MSKSRKYESRTARQRRLLKEDMRGKVLKAADNRCYICNQHLSVEEVTVDHVFPKKDGYKIEGNAMPCHLSCNKDKKHRFPHQHEIRGAVEAYEKCGLLFDPRFSQKHVTYTPSFTAMVQMLHKDVMKWP